MPPLENIKFAAAVLAVVLALGCGHYLDGAPSDMQAEEATAASLRDALAQAQAERPDLWTPERRARAAAAAGLVARGVQP
jgi:hypothetical protein